MNNLLVDRRLLSIASTFAVVCVLLTYCCELVKAEARPAKPNIIIMMADDMGIGDTSAYLGVRLSRSAPPIERTLRTPNLERFARSSIVFTDGYAPASMCSSTRYSLLTGRSVSYTHLTLPTILRV